MTDIILLLDSSGSMQDMGDEPVQALNGFINDQKELKTDTLFSLYTFNTDVKVVYKNIPLTLVPEYKDFQPERMTSLFDCIKQAVEDKMATNRHKNVVMVIITDGQDTCSKTKKEETIQLIKTQEKEHNWQFIYLGANQDSFKMAAGLGISPALSSNYKGDNMKDILRQISTPIALFRKESCSNPFVKIEKL